MNEVALGVIDEYKRANCYPLYLFDCDLASCMIPIGYRYKDHHPEIIPLICRWRNENGIGFANRFAGTFERTENWIDNVLLPREDRILFMIHSGSKWVGHIGLSNFDDTSCEIDNVVKGDKDAPKGIMSLATKELVRWAKETLEVEDIYLRVLSDNPHAIKFYLRLGFEVVGEIPLYRRESKNMIEWTEEPNGGEPEKYFIKMKLK